MWGGGRGGGGVGGVKIAFPVRKTNIKYASEIQFLCSPVSDKRKCFSDHGSTSYPILLFIYVYWRT